MSSHRGQAGLPVPDRAEAISFGTLRSNPPSIVSTIALLLLTVAVLTLLIGARTQGTAPATTWSPAPVPVITPSLTPSQVLAVRWQEAVSQPGPVLRRHFGLRDTSRVHQVGDDGP